MKRSIGPINRNEVVCFQNAHGLRADGFVGNQTWGFVMDRLFYEKPNGAHKRSFDWLSASIGGIVGAFLALMF